MPMPRTSPEPTAARTQSHLRAVAMFCVGTLVGFAVVLAAAWPNAARSQIDEAARLQKLKASFARPGYVPHPVDNPPSAAKIALGKTLFEDTKISSTGTISCASCHDAKLGFADGEPKGKGVTGRRLVRHTPTIWNAAFSPLLFWDGRAGSLEDQVRFPIAHPDEMGGSLDEAVTRLSKVESYRQAFAEAFDGDTHVTKTSIAKALAAYERTLISPPTRFDRWIAGDASAFGSQEERGFAIFTGKGRCSNCHTGSNLTDHGFYDIGLPGTDEGRGEIIGLAATRHAFKTPTLREIAWTAPYMHDGSLATLDEVIRHYESGGIKRASLSQDMPKGLKLSDGERADLLAFLDTLSSDAPPRPSTEAWVLGTGAQPSVPPAATGTVVHQAGKLFAPARIQIGRDDALTIVNDDTRTHNVRIYDQRMDFNSGAQEPSQSVTIRFAGPGTYDAFCGIHPSMRLRIDVK